MQQTFLTSFSNSRKIHKNTLELYPSLLFAMLEIGSLTCLRVLSIERHRVCGVAMCGKFVLIFLLKQVFVNFLNLFYSTERSHMPAFMSILMSFSRCSNVRYEPWI